MTQRTETDIVRNFLTHQRHLEADVLHVSETITRGRRRTIELARRYGLEWEEIGIFLDITGEAARKWYERHGHI